MARKSKIFSMDWIKTR